MAGCTASSLALSDREERKKGFQPSELWLLSEKERKKGKEKKLTNLFAVGAEVSGGDRSFVTFKITFQNRILLGGKVVRFESGCRIRTLEVRGQRCLSPPGPKRTSQLRRAVRRRGHHNPAERLRHCPSSHPEGSPSGGTPSPDTGASRRGTRPPRRAAGARRSLPSPSNLPGDSDAGAPRNPAGKSGSQLSLSPERRDPGSSAHRSTRALRLAPGSWAICGALGPGLPPRPARPGVVPLPRSRCPRVGSGSGGDLTGPEAMRGADGTRGLGGAGKGRDKGREGEKNTEDGNVRLPEGGTRCESVEERECLFF